MGLLANKSNDQVLNKKSIKIVIELMWSHYQPSIIKYIFFPYFLYLASISTMASGFCGRLVLVNYEIQDLSEIKYQPDGTTILDMEEETLR